jgi:hypothetical protein
LTVEQKAKAIGCLNDMRQMLLAPQLYIDANSGAMIPLRVERGVGGCAWNVDPLPFAIGSPHFQQFDLLQSAEDRQFYFVGQE